MGNDMINFWGLEVSLWGRLLPPLPPPLALDQQPVRGGGRGHAACLCECVHVCERERGRGREREREGEMISFTVCKAWNICMRFRGSCRTTEFVYAKGECIGIVARYIQGCGKNLHLPHPGLEDLSWQVQVDLVDLGEEDKLKWSHFEVSVLSMPRKHN